MGLLVWQEEFTPLGAIRTRGCGTQTLWAVVIGTRPETAETTMRECAELGIKHVWMHRSFGTGSVSEAATGYGRQQGIMVIDGGCPLMFDPTADLGHKAMRFVCTLTGKVPRRV